MNAVQWTSLFTFLVAWWFDMFQMLGLRIDLSRYRLMKTKAFPKPPIWAFKVINCIVYPLAAVAGHQYLNWTDHSRPIFDAVFSMYLATLILEKIWGPVFFRVKWLWVSLLIVCLEVLTALSGLIIMWIDTANNGVSCYVAAGIYIPFVLWVLYKFLLNFDIAYNNGHIRFMYTEDVTTSSKKVIAPRYVTPRGNGRTIIVMRAPSASNALRGV